MKLRLVPVATVLALVGALQANPILTDWTRVEAVQPGKRILVRLYKDSATPVSPTISGQFASATASGISLVQPDGTPLMITKDRIRRVAIWRTSRKRARNAAIAGGVGTGIGMLIGGLVTVVAGSGSGGTWDELLVSAAMIGALVGGPLALISTLREPREVIFNVPPKHRLP